MNLFVFLNYYFINFTHYDFNILFTFDTTFVNFNQMKKIVNFLYIINILYTFLKSYLIRYNYPLLIIPTRFKFYQLLIFNS
jgi:hypothetical protein